MGKRRGSMSLPPPWPQRPPRAPALGCGAARLDQFKATAPTLNPRTTPRLSPRARTSPRGRSRTSDTQANNVAGLATGANGLGGVLAQQQGLAGQLQGTINGTGPNAAQSQFQQNTNQNIAQEAGSIESTKGINPALAAKMAATNGAAQQQAAAGTALTTQAQQQVAAQQQLAAQQQAEAGTIGGQGSLYSTAGGLNQAAGNLGASTLGSSISGQGAQNNAINTGGLGEQGLDAGVSALNTQIAGNLAGAGINAVGGAGATLFNGLTNPTTPNANVTQQYTGGEIPASHYAEGGLAATPVPDESQGVLASILRSAAPPYVPPAQAASSGGKGPNLTSLGSFLAAPSALNVATEGTGVMGAAGETGTGGLVGAGEALAPEAAMVAAHGGEAPEPVDAKAMSLAQALMARGGAVPGKDAVPGKNSPKNDTVPAVLSPHEIVLPLSVTQSDDAPAKAAAFVEQLKAKAHPTYGKVLQARKALSDATAAHKAVGGMC